MLFIPIEVTIMVYKYTFPERGWVTKCNCDCNLNIRFEHIKIPSLYTHYLPESNDITLLILQKREFSEKLKTRII